MNQEYLKRLVDYKGGKLYWREREGSDRFTKTFNSKFAGKEIGSITPSGYLETAVNQRRYLVHRLIFLYHHGYFPKQIDHADGDSLNNHIENLRSATPSENQCNTGLQKNNHSGAGIKGVYKHGGTGWRVQVMKDGVTHYRGGLRTKEEAERVASRLRSDLHGDFGRNV